MMNAMGWLVQFLEDGCVVGLRLTLIPSAVGDRAQEDETRLDAITDHTMNNRLFITTPAFGRSDGVSRICILFMSTRHPACVSLRLNQAKRAQSCIRRPPDRAKYCRAVDRVGCKDTEAAAAATVASRGEMRLLKLDRKRVVDLM